jgi:hypothetical protein
MAGRQAVWEPGQIMPRALGYGAITGGGIGLTIGLVLTAVSGGVLAILVIVGLVFGVLAGIVCGLPAGVVLLCAGAVLAARTPAPIGLAGRRRVPVHAAAMNLAAGAGAALSPLGIATYFAAAGNTGLAHLYLFAAAVLFALGTPFGPAVAYGPARRKEQTRPPSPAPQTYTRRRD